MPSYSTRCERCEHYRDFVLLARSSDANPACEKCGGATYRWAGGKPPNVIGDTYHTALVDDVMTEKRQVFQTKSEHRAAMKANGLIHRDRHAPMPGTDTDPHSTRWATPPPYVTAEGERARLMAWQLHSLMEKGDYSMADQSNQMIISRPNGADTTLPCGSIESREHAMLEEFRRFKLKYRLKSAMYCDVCNQSAEFRITPTSFVWACSCRALHFPPV